MVPVANQDVSSWDTSSVNSLSYSKSAAVCCVVLLLCLCADRVLLLLLLLLLQPLLCQEFQPRLSSWDTPQITYLGSSKSAAVCCVVLLLCLCADPCVVVVAVVVVAVNGPAVSTKTCPHGTRQCHFSQLQ